MNNISIKYKFIIVFSSIIFVIATFLSILSIYSLHELSDSDIEKFSQSKYNDKTMELQHSIQIAMSIVKHHYKSIVVISLNGS